MSELAAKQCSRATATATITATSPKRGHQKLVKKRRLKELDLSQRSVLRKYCGACAGRLGTRYPVATYYLAFVLCLLGS